MFIIYCNQIIDDIKENLNNKQLEPSPYRIRSNNRNNIDRSLKNCRYEDQIAIFKNEI